MLLNIIKSPVSLLTLPCKFLQDSTMTSRKLRELKKEFTIYSSLFEDKDKR